MADGGGRCGTGAAGAVKVPPGDLRAHGRRCKVWTRDGKAVAIPSHQRREDGHGAEASRRRRGITGQVRWLIVGLLVGDRWSLIVVTTSQRIIIMVVSGGAGIQGPWSSNWVFHAAGRGRRMMKGARTSRCRRRSEGRPGAERSVEETATDQPGPASRKHRELRRIGASTGRRLVAGAG
jgi:hypothetical protein